MLDGGVRFSAQFDFLQRRVQGGGFFGQGERIPRSGNSRGGGGSWLDHYHHHLSFRERFWLNAEMKFSREAIVKEKNTHSREKGYFRAVVPRDNDHQFQGRNIPNEVYLQKRFQHHPNISTTILFSCFRPFINPIGWFSPSPRFSCLQVLLRFYLLSSSQEA